MNLDKTKLQFKPVYDRVVIHPEEKEKVSKGGIIFSETAEQTVNKGFVVAAGEQVSSVKEGDYVYYDSIHCGTVMFNDTLFHIARDKPDGQIELILEQQ